MAELDTFLDGDHDDDEISLPDLGVSVNLQRLLTDSSSPSSKGLIAKLLETSWTSATTHGVLPKTKKSVMWLPLVLYERLALDQDLLASTCRVPLFDSMYYEI